MPGVRRVRIVTDSTADLPPDLVSHWGIQVIPTYVHLGEKSFRDGIDLTLEELLARLRAKEYATTSQPSLGVFKRIYEQSGAGGGEIVSIHLSAGLSGTYQAALLAAEQVDGHVAVVDSTQLSMAMGWLVLAAAQAAREGRSQDEIVAMVEEMKSRCHLFCLIESLEHLRRGGRIGRAQEALGALFNVRPIITVRQGVVTLVERVRTRAAGLRQLVDLMGNAGPLERVSVLHAGAPEEAEQVADALAPIFPRQDILVKPAGLVVTTHVGPEAVGVCYVAARQGSQEDRLWRQQR